MGFYVKRINGKVYGPFPHEDLRRFAAEGRLSQQDLLLEEGTDRWVTALQLLDSFPVQQPDQPVPSMHQVAASASANHQTTKRPTARATLKLAALRPRAWSWIFDYSLFFIVSTITLLGVLFFFLAKFDLTKLTFPQILFSLFVYILLPSLIYVIVTAAFIASLKQATPGKQINKIRVVTLSGGRVSFGRALARQVACVLIVYIPLVNVVTYLLPLWNRRKQTIHDMIAGTVVVTDK
jgi:uncharacterized RDD family membrane protein YckC